MTQLLVIAGAVGKDAVLRRTHKTPKELEKMLKYDPETGKLVWANRSWNDFTCIPQERKRVASRWNKNRAGKEAGIINARGYRVVCIEGRTYQAHRIAIALTTGAWPDGQVDHINHNKADNSLQNLRVVSPQINSQNRPLPSTNSSGAIGVHFHVRRKKWCARIWANGRRIHLGGFDSKEDAIAARESASRQYGFHPNHGAA